LAKFIEACIAGGVDVVQLREKHLEAREVLAAATIAKKVCAHYGVPFILNDRPDLALEVDADGVHVGQEDAPPSLARRILGENRLVGLSTHRAEEVMEANQERLDYVSAGPVLATPTKPGRPGTGQAYVRFASSISRWPVFVTGGVTPDLLEPSWRVGARHFVVVRYLTEASDPKGNARKLRDKIEELMEKFPGLQGTIV
jgi:thiamine-phosphate pyrophosphorylase